MRHRKEISGVTPYGAYYVGLTLRNFFNGWNWNFFSAKLEVERKMMISLSIECYLTLGLPVEEDVLVAFEDSCCRTSVIGA